MARHLDELIRDEDGLTTAGMAVSLMLCLALIFSGAQLYRVSSASSEIQEVADVAALAAESEVAEFMIAAKTCDAALLSMTLLAATVYGIGIVCACVPPLAALSEQLISLGARISSARDRFYDAASAGLNSLQKVLPFLAAASAASVASANDRGAMNASYRALAVLVPQTGVDIGSSASSSLCELEVQVEGDAQDIRDAAAEAEQFAEEANEAKERAYAYDCGNSPDYCMYERAEHLSGVSGGNNPYYSSIDAWSFSVALDRAKAYYAARLTESPPSGSTQDKASYYLRKRFYSYCKQELSGAYVSESDDSFSAHVPRFFRNTAEMRSTELYTESVYPVSGGGEGGIMHAYSGCPAAGSISSYGSLSDLDAHVYVGCTVCNFSVESMGNVASASTNIPNGFEHHYEQVRQAVEEYKSAMERLTPLKAAVQDKVNPIMDKVGSVISEAAGNRISAEPPGRGGTIVMLVNTAHNAADTGFESMFVGGGATLGTRASVSAAALVEDSSHDNATVITSLLDGFDDSGGAVIGAARIVLDCWSSLLRVYEDGQTALMDALENGLNSVSTNSSSGLGTWASGVLRSVVESAGLQPADLKALKPALLNTQHVAESDSGSFATSFKQVKTSALSTSSPSADLFSGVATGISDAVTDAVTGTTITIAEIEFPIGDMTIPITLTLPPSAGEAAGGLVSQCLDAVLGTVGSNAGVRAWQ